MATKHQVTFLPMNQTFEAEAGESLLDVAIRNDVPLAHACGGFCACTTCHVEVKTGDSALSEVEEEESERLERVPTGLTLHSRLGCQAKVKGNVVVEIQNIGTGH